MATAFCEQFYNKNQFLINDGNQNIIFQSYDSSIAILSREGCETLTLGKNWDYSKTTLKHLYLFFNEYVKDFCENSKFLADNIDFDKFNATKNKRAFIQKLIDNNIIRLNNAL